ncbi:MAG: hypothetical protein HY078_15490 [Elusimicrobia bacterium]|nr:hypothetical protein [Elusimicrobiota bacterium]
MKLSLRFLVAALAVFLAAGPSPASAKRKKLVEKDPELDKMTKVPPVGKAKKSKGKKKAVAPKRAKPKEAPKPLQDEEVYGELPIGNGPVGGPGSPLAIRDSGTTKPAKNTGAPPGGSLVPPIPVDPRLPEGRINP